MYSAALISKQFQFHRRAVGCTGKNQRLSSGFSDLQLQAIKMNLQNVAHSLCGLPGFDSDGLALGLPQLSLEGRNLALDLTEFLLAYRRSAIPPFGLFREKSGGGPTSRRDARVFCSRFCASDNSSWRSAI